MKDNIWLRILTVGIIFTLVLSLGYYFLGKKQLEYRFCSEWNQEKIDHVIGEMVDGSVIEQTFYNKAELLKGITIRFANYGNIPLGTVSIIVTQDEVELYRDEIDVALLPDSEDYYIQFDKDFQMINDAELKLRLEFFGASTNHALTVWIGDKLEGMQLSVNDEVIDGSLYLIQSSYVNDHYLIKYIWSVIGFLIVFSVICVYEMLNKHKKTPLSEFIHIFGKYRFLLGQLISRDFKNKYRRSYLGILWSLLNPLLMMALVSAVFSFVFRFQIKNFQVYLILGQFIFNFYSEATQVSLSTVIGNGQLIKKVYLPKYIFPLSKTMFSFVNSLISIIAVAAVMVFYRTPITLNILYLPLLMVSYFVFTLGISLVLSAMTVFLRDIQYLYTVVVTALGYLTPIFYPVESLVPWMQTILKLNPLYHYLHFIREILLYGRPPQVHTVVICIGLAIIVFLFGLNYFYKRQKRFILYI